jgi:hypothetical protein
MYFAAKSVFARLLGQKSHFAQSKSRSRRCRLVGEQLETRYALSTLDGGVPDDSLPPTDSTPPADTSADPPAGDPPPGDPPPVDPPMDPPGSGQGNQAPVIHDFTLTTVGNWSTARGWVSDDQDVTSYLVDLTGLINTSVSVGADHYFSYVFQLDPEAHGSIYAQTQDFYGLFSNDPMVSI